MHNSQIATLPGIAWRCVRLAMPAVQRVPADRVALLADGRIVAEDSHEKLLRTNSRYRELMGGES